LNEIYEDMRPMALMLVALWNETTQNRRWHETSGQKKSGICTIHASMSASSAALQAGVPPWVSPPCSQPGPVARARRSERLKWPECFAGHWLLAGSAPCAPCAERRHATDCLTARGRRPATRPSSKPAHVSRVSRDHTYLVMPPAPAKPTGETAADCEAWA